MLVACGGDPDPRPDDGAEGDGPDGGSEAAPRENGPNESGGALQIEVPRFVDWTCPAGWIARLAEEGRPTEFTFCVPPARVQCPWGQVQHIDESECRPLDDPCPLDAGPESARIDAAAVGYPGARHVATDDASLAAALDAAEVGDVVWLAPGEYAGPVRADGVALVGACASGVRLVSEIGRDPTVTLGPAARLYGVTVQGGSPGVEARGDGFSIVRVEVVGSGETGLFVRDAAGAVRETVVRETRPPVNGLLAGVLVSAKAEVVLDRVVADRIPGWGFRLIPHGSGRITMTDCVAVDARVDAGDVSGGVGLSLQGGERHVLRRLLVDGPTDTGLDIGAAKRIELYDAVVRNLFEPRGPIGVRTEGADVHVERLAIYNVVGLALNAFWDTDNRDESGAGLRMTDVVVQGTGSTTRLPGRGIQLSDGVRATLQRVAIDGVSDVGLFVGRSITPDRAVAEVSLEDIAVRNTGSKHTLDGGQGIGVDGGSQVQVRRVLLEDNRAMAIVAAGWAQVPETSLTVYDVAIRRTLPAACAEVTEGRHACGSVDDSHSGGGYGVAIVRGARATLADFRVTGSQMAGLYYDADSVLRASSGVVTDNAFGLIPGAGPETVLEWFEDVEVFDNAVDYPHTTPPVPDPPTILLR